MKRARSVTSDNGGLDDDNRCGLFHTVILLKIDLAHLDLLNHPRSPGHNCNPAQFQVNSIQPVCGTKSNSEQTNTKPGEGRGGRKKGKGELTLGLVSNVFLHIMVAEPCNISLMSDSPSWRITSSSSLAKVTICSKPKIQSDFQSIRGCSWL